VGIISLKGLFVLVIIHMYWVGLSRFKSITSQNSSQSHPIDSNTHVISITEQALIGDAKKRTKACHTLVCTAAGWPGKVR
jgi:hypothetical protein